MFYGRSRCVGTCLREFCPKEWNRCLSGKLCMVSPTQLCWSYQSLPLIQRNDHCLPVCSQIRKWVGCRCCCSWRVRTAMYHCREGARSCRTPWPARTRRKASRSAGNNPPSGLPWRWPCAPPWRRRMPGRRLWLPPATGIHLTLVSNKWSTIVASQWRHNGRDGVSNQRKSKKSKKTPKLRVTDLCAGNSPGTGEFPAQMASDAENVSIWWRHHVCLVLLWIIWYATHIAANRYEDDGMPRERFRMTGVLWGESTGDRWIPITKSPVIWSFFCWSEVTVERTA